MPVPYNNELRNCRFTLHVEHNTIRFVFEPGVERNSVKIHSEPLYIASCKPQFDSNRSGAFERGHGATGVAPAITLMRNAVQPFTFLPLVKLSGDRTFWHDRDNDHRWQLRQSMEAKWMPNLQILHWSLEKAIPLILEMHMFFKRVLGRNDFSGFTYFLKSRSYRFLTIP